MNSTPEQFREIESLRNRIENRIPYVQLEIGAIYDCYIDRVGDSVRAKYLGNGQFEYEEAPDKWLGIKNWSTRFAYDASLNNPSSIVFPLEKLTDVTDFPRK
jgi:hypothetical protein